VVIDFSSSTNQPEIHMSRTISAIAYDIGKEWGAKTNYAARPYLMAMLNLSDIGDSCGYDSARSIILYFLSNASSFRGPRAKELKAELKSILANK